MEHDVGRLSDPGLLILASLSGGAKHGYAILEDIVRFSSVRFEPGTLYGALARLESEGLVVALEPAGRRRPYAMTPSGQRVLEARLATMERVVTVGRQRVARAALDARP
jgi:DNA-binding PadR family transcriptional regulator